MQVRLQCLHCSTANWLAEKPLLFQISQTVVGVSINTLEVSPIVGQETKLNEFVIGYFLSVTMYLKCIFKKTNKCTYLLFTVRDIADTAPRKGLVRIEFAIGAVDVKTLSIHSK